jgi:hypothetical protein
MSTPRPAVRIRPAITFLYGPRKDLQFSTHYLIDNYNLSDVYNFKMFYVLNSDRSIFVPT